MSQVKIQGHASGTGIFTVTSPNSNTDRTLTLPDASGAFNISGAVNEVPAGSASAPSISPTGDSNTGMFFPAADTIAFAEGGTEVMRIDSSGNLGVGIVPSVWTSYTAAQVGAVGSLGSANFGGGNQQTVLLNNAYHNSGFKYLTSSVAAMYRQLGGEHQWHYAASGTAGNAITFTQAMTLDSSGNFLVGTTSVPSGGQRFTISGGITPATDNSFIFGNSGLRWQALYAANGTIQTSDERDKCDIVDSPLGLNFINALRPVAYKFKVGKNEVSTNEDGDQVVTAIPGKRQHFGLLAQQVRDVVGNTDFGGWILTDTTDPDSPQGLRYDEFIAPMVKAIQEQQTLITSLTARIAALEGAAQ